MGILSRFRDIMASNMNALLDKAEDPEKMIDDFMRSINSDLGKVKAETASVLADERRANRALDECKAEIRKLQVYAEKAVEADQDDDARKFLEKKVRLVEKETQLQAVYDAAATNSASMKQMQDKLMSDIDQLETRRVLLKEKMIDTKMQQKLNSIGSSQGGSNGSVFGAMEEKVNSAYDEAMAIAELRAGTNNNIDAEFEQLEKSINSKATTNTEADDELAAIKEKMKKNK